jgi:hypothetical protein
LVPSLSQIASFEDAGSENVMLVDTISSLKDSGDRRPVKFGRKDEVKYFDQSHWLDHGLLWLGICDQIVHSVDRCLYWLVDSFTGVYFYMFEVS